jgi:DNA-binding NarL/FixJ family response regulator
MLAMDLLSVVIVDDDARFRSVAAGLLARSGFTVIGEAADGMAGVAMAARTQADLILVDIRLPDIDGFEVVRRLLESPEPPAIVLVSTLEAADYGRRIPASGARGFITKSSLSGDTLRGLLSRNEEERT